MPVTSIHPSSNLKAPTVEGLEKSASVDEEIALHKFQDLLFTFITLIQENRRLLSRVVDENMENYKAKTEEIKEYKDAQGWTGLELTLAGTTLGALAPFIPHLDGASCDLKELFDILGGVDTVKKTLETLSHFSEGVKPVVNTWAEGKTMPQQMKKEFLENAFRQGQEAERQSRELVQKLLHIADEVYNKYSETRYR